MRVVLAVWIIGTLFGIGTASALEPPSPLVITLQDRPPLASAADERAAKRVLGLALVGAGMIVWLRQRRAG